MKGTSSLEGVFRVLVKAKECGELVSLEILYLYTKAVYNISREGERARNSGGFPEQRRKVIGNSFRRFGGGEND